MQVEPGEEVAGAEPEARREHARVPVGVDAVTRFVVCPSSRGARRARRAARARARRAEAAQPRQPGERLRHAGEAAARQEAAPGVGARRPARSSAPRTRRGRRGEIAHPPRRSSSSAPRSCPCRTTAAPSVGEQLERRREPRLREQVAGLEQAPRRARRSARRRCIVITGSSIARQAACAGGIGDARRARAAARARRAAPTAAARSARVQRAEPARAAPARRTTPAPTA